MDKPTDEFPDESSPKDNESNPDQAPSEQSTPVDQEDSPIKSEGDVFEEGEYQEDDSGASDPIDVDDTSYSESQEHESLEYIPDDQNVESETTDLVDTSNSEEYLLQQAAGVFLLWWNWAFIEITIVKPEFSALSSPIILMPELLQNSSEAEFVYPICDHGNRLSSSKGADMYSVGMSMCKLFYTVEKMIFILVERLTEMGIDPKTEVQVSFDGHIQAQRKAFEAIINLNHNVVVTNFDPGTWGERYLEIVKRLADKGYGYPSEAPRDVYKIGRKTTGAVKR